MIESTEEFFEEDASAGETPPDPVEEGHPLFAGLDDDDVLGEEKGDTPDPDASEDVPETEERPAYEIKRMDAAARRTALEAEGVNVGALDRNDPRLGWDVQQQYRRR